MNTQTRNKPVDLVETAQKMLDAAVAVTTGRLHLPDPAAAARLLAGGDRLAVYHFRVEMARQIASALLMMDSRVIAVFEDRHASVDIELSAPLHLWVQVTCRTAALNTVVDALNQALGQAYAQMFDALPSSVFDAIIIDNHNNRLLQAGITRPDPAPVLLVQRD